MRSRLTIWPTLALVCACCFGGEDPAAEANLLLKKVGVSSGICCLPRCGDGKLALAIAKASRMIVYAQDSRPALVAAARHEAARAGLLGKQVYVEAATPGRIPFADNYLDLLVLSDMDASGWKELSAKEAARALSPGGRVVISQAKDASVGFGQPALEAWLKDGMAGAAVTAGEQGLKVEWTKPFPKEMDDWSHWFHGPDNNPVSTDAALKWPFATQWLGLPFHAPQPNNTLVSAGRMFTFTGHGWRGYFETDPEMMEMIQRLLVRSAYNGEILWERKLPDNYLAHRSCAVATPEILYMLDGPGVLRLDSRTGRELGRIDFQGVSGEGKWLAMVGRKLFILAGEKDPTLKDQISRYGTIGIKSQEIGWGFGTQIAAYDLDRGETAWVHSEPRPIDSRAIGILDQRLFFYAPAARLGCRDADSGKEVWINSEPATLQTIEEPVVGNHESPIITRSNTGLLCLPGSFTLQTPGKKNWLAFSTANGKPLWNMDLWKSGVSNAWGRVHQVGIGGQVYAAGKIFDAMTGESKGGVSFGGTICGRMTVSPDGFYGQRGRGYDRVTKERTPGQGLKAGCYDGSIPACGLLLATPHSCICQVSFRGYVAFGSAGADFPLSAKAVESERLESAGATKPPAAFATTAEDWTCHRANGDHSGSSKASVPQTARPLWTIPAGRGLAQEPAAAGGLVFVGRDTGIIEAFDGATGALTWSFITGGRILGSPVIGAGLVFVGSGDGFVYALEAASGTLRWRLRVSPMLRRIMVHGYLIDTWPVGPGLLFHEGTVYAAAGLNSLDGTYVYAIDAVRGTIRWQNSTSGHLDAKNRRGAVPGALTVADGCLWMAGGALTGPIAYDLSTGELRHDNYGSKAGINPGGEIGIFRKGYLYFGGPYAVRGPRERLTYGVSSVSFLKLDAAANALYPEVEAGRASAILPAWDESLFVVLPYTPDSVCFWDPAALEKMLAEEKTAPLPKEPWKQPKPKSWQGRPPQPTDKAAALVRWTSERRRVGGVAIAANAVVVVWTDKNRVTPKWFLAALDRVTGLAQWEIELPGEPLPNALCLDRRGSTIVSFRDGAIGCFGASP